MSNSIKVKVLDRNTLELSEDAKAGDIIELDKIESLDTGFISSLLSKEKDNYIKREIEKAVQEKEELFKSEKENLLLKKEQELNVSFKLKLDELNEKNAELKSKFEQELIKVKEEAKSKEKELTNEINTFKENRAKDIVLEKNKIEKSFNEEKEKIKEKYDIEFAKLNEIKIALETELKNFEKVKEAEIKAAQEVAKNKEKDELEEKHKKEIEEYQKIIDQLKRNKSSLNSKNIGEDLENWCDHEVRQYMQNGLLNCTWEKDNKVIKNEDENKGSKADFIFKIYADEKKEKETLLTSVCLEMKDENPDSVNKKTNKDYYNQLDKNRIKKECRYAVLVSDLERDKPNDLSIYKVLEYQDMYIVRPEYMMTFLNMLVSLNTTFAKLTLLKSREDEKFKSYDELQEEFEKIKKSYLDDQLSKLENEVINLEKHNKTISDASLKINESIRKIRDNYIDQIKDKLEKFEIKISKQYKRTFKD